MVYDNHPNGGRALSIAIGAFLFFFAFMGCALGNVNITKIGHFGGLINKVEVSGNYAYIGQGSYFVVLDISDKTSPVEVGRVETSENIVNIAIAENYAYVADGYNGLIIIDISDPAIPTLKGSYDTIGFSNGVGVAGNYAYVADGSNGLVIINISDPAMPTLYGSFDTVGYSIGVEVAGNHAYVADGFNGLVIIDVRNPALPIFKGSFDTAGSSRGVTVVDNHAYVVDGFYGRGKGDGLVIIDISNPSSPALEGSYDTSNSFEVIVAENYAYVADYTNGLLIIDISNPSSPALQGSYVTNGLSYGVKVAENYAYVAENDNGLEIFLIDVSSELAPIKIMNPGANPALIVNDNGRPRSSGTNTTRLNVTVTGNVASVNIDLSPIGGLAMSPMTRISGTDIYTTTTNAISGINLTSNLVVNVTEKNGAFNNSVTIPVTVLLRGDIKRDNKIDSKDLLYLRRYLAGLEPSINILAADIQPAGGDGNVDLEDLAYLRRKLVNLESLI